VASRKGDGSASFDGDRGASKEGETTTSNGEKDLFWPRQSILMLSYVFITGETIRIFRRSRPSRPQSATRADSVMVVDDRSIPSGTKRLAGTNSMDSDPVPASPAPSSSGGDADFSGAPAGSAVLRTEELPAPDTSAGTKEAYLN